MIELITTSIFVLSSIYGGPSATGVDIMSTTTAPWVIARVEEKLTSKEIENIAKVYFKSDPILVEVARCESSFRQLDTDGEVLKGTVNKGDLGLMQINKYYHAEKAESMGLDLETLHGNMGYAKYLYNKEGLKPWGSSKPCWKAALKTADNKQVALK